MLVQGPRKTFKMRSRNPPKIDKNLSRQKTESTIRGNVFMPFQGQRFRTVLGATFSCRSSGNVFRSFQENIHSNPSSHPSLQTSMQTSSQQRPRSASLRVHARSSQLASKQARSRKGRRTRIRWRTWKRKSIHRRNQTTFNNSVRNRKLLTKLLRHGTKNDTKS